MPRSTARLNSISVMEMSCPVRHVAVTPGVDTDVNVGLVHHLQRDANGVRIARRKMLHGAWEDALTQAGIHRLLAMLRQIE